MAQRSKVLSLRISNKNLASCLYFEVLLKGENPSDKLSSSITLLLESAIRILKENKSIPDFSESEAEEVIKNFLRRTGRTVIGKEEIFKKGMELGRGLENIRRKRVLTKETLSPAVFSEEVPSPEKEEKGEEVSRTAEKERLECFDRREDDRITEQNLLTEFDETVEKEAELLRAEDDFSLLQKIFLPSK